MAREMWGSPAAALGQADSSGLKDEWREMVGVVADVYDRGVDQKAPSTAYWPLMMDNFELSPVQVARFGVFAVRTNRAGTDGFLTEARKADLVGRPGRPVFLVRTLKEVYDKSMARTSFTLVLLGIAGSMALVLGVVGIYGVIAYAVTQRTREIGIRMALGAQSGGLQGMFVRQGLLFAAVGASVGVDCGGRAHSADVVDVVPDHPARSSDVLGCGCGAYMRGGPGQLHSGAAGDGGGSGGSAADGIRGQ